MTEDRNDRPLLIGNQVRVAGTRWHGGLGRVYKILVGKRVIVDLTVAGKSFSDVFDAKDLELVYTTQPKPEEKEEPEQFEFNPLAYLRQWVELHTVDGHVEWLKLDDEIDRVQKYMDADI